LPSANNPRTPLAIQPDFHCSRLGGRRGCLAGSADGWSRSRCAALVSRFWSGIFRAAMPFCLLYAGALELGLGLDQAERVRSGGIVCAAIARPTNWILTSCRYEHFLAISDFLP